MPAAALGAAGFCWAKAGREEEAFATLSDLKAFSADNFVPAYNFAMIYNGLGRRKEALDHIERSFKDREVQISFINIDTRWDEMRNEPRFQWIIEQMKFGQNN